MRDAAPMGAQSTPRLSGGSREGSPRRAEEGASPASASSGRRRQRSASQHPGVRSPSLGGGSRGSGRPSPQPRARFGAGGTYRAGGCSKCLFHMGTARRELPSIGTGRDPELRGPRRAPAPPPPPAPLPRDPGRAPTRSVHVWGSGCMGGVRRGVSPKPASAGWARQPRLSFPAAPAWWVQPQTRGAQG